MLGPPADLGPWADGPNGASTATPNSTPNSTLVMSASQPSSTWEGVEESSSQFPYGTDRTAVVRRVAPVTSGDGNWERSSPANPVDRNSLNYRDQGGWHTYAGANAPVPNISRRATPQKQWVKKFSPFEFLRGSSEAVGSKHETPIPT